MPSCSRRTASLGHAIDSDGGCEIGAGRALFVAFARPPDAVGAAEAARRELVPGARPDGDR
jgi:hypothetical protein